MGVHNLWKLLGPCGVRIDLSALRGKQVAVDVSVWLVSFVKAMRHKDGTLIANAHLIGLFRRISRLLHFGIKPVFVFDGPAPSLKRKTLAQRRRQRNKSRNSLRQMAERILLQKLKIHSLDKLKQAALAAAGADAASADVRASTDVQDGGDDDVSLRVVPCSDEDSSSNEEGQDDDDDFLVHGSVVLPENGVADEVFLASLPRSLRWQVLQQQREMEEEGNAVKFAMAASATPAAFSELQLTRFLDASASNKRIRELRAEIGGAESRKLENGGGDPPHRVGPEPWLRAVRRRGGPQKQQEGEERRSKDPSQQHRRRYWYQQQQQQQQQQAWSKERPRGSAGVPVDGRVAASGCTQCAIESVSCVVW